MPDETKHVLTRGEKIFVGGFAVFIFVVSLGFVVATVGWGLGFPAVFVALALGMCIASIVYAFLGGVAGAEFLIMAGLKVAGSLAAIAIVYWLVSGPFEKNMNDVRLIEIGRSAEADLLKSEADAAKERTARRKLELRVAELESGARITESDTVAATLAKVRSSTANDDLGEGILTIYRNREGPFRRQATQFKARFLHAVPQGTFWFCHDRRPELQGKDVRFELVDREAGTSEKITLRAGGDIGLAVCQDIPFDVQLGCDAASELLKLQCTPQRGVAWPEGNAARTFDLVATNLNPDF